MSGCRSGDALRREVKRDASLTPGGETATLHFAGGKAGTLTRPSKAGGTRVSDFRKTKNCIRTNPTKVAGGTAKSLAIKILCVIVERQSWTVTTVVNQLDRTTVRYCISWRT